MPRRVLLLGLALLAACGPHFPSITPVPVADARLNGPEGSVSFLSLVREKRLTLVFFGYTHCPDFCPSAMRRLGEVAADLSEAERAGLSILFISVDPTRDTPRIADAYAKKFNPTFRGFNGDPAEVISMLRRYGRLEIVPAIATDRPYLVDHTTSILWFENQMHSKNIPASFIVSDLLADLKRVL